MSNKPGHTFHTVCSGCRQMHEIGTNCKCGYLSVADDAISVDDLPILGCMSYMGVSSDGKVAGWVCNNDHEHQGKIVVITHVMNGGDKRNSGDSGCNDEHLRELTSIKNTLNDIELALKILLR